MNWCMALVELAQNKHGGLKRDLLALSPDNKRLLCRDRREVLTALNTVASKRAHPSATRGANGTSRTDIIWPNLLRALYNRGVCFVPASRHSVEGAFIRKSGEPFVPLGKGWEDVDLEAIFKSDRKKRRRTKRSADEEGPGERPKRPAGSKREEGLPSSKAGHMASSRVSAAGGGAGGSSAASLSTALAARLKMQGLAMSQAAAARNNSNASILNSLGSLQGLSGEALTQLVVQLQVRHRDAEMREVQLREAVIFLQKENTALRQRIQAMAASSQGAGANAAPDAFARPRSDSGGDLSSASGAVASGGRLVGPAGSIAPGPPTAGGGSVHGAMMPGLMSPTGAGGDDVQDAALMLMGGATPGGAGHPTPVGGPAEGFAAAAAARGRRGSMDMDELAADASAAREAMRASEAAALSASDATGIKLHAPSMEGVSLGPPTLTGEEGGAVIGYTPRDRKRGSLLMMGGESDHDLEEAADALQALSGGLTPGHAEDRATSTLAAAASIMASQSAARRGSGSGGFGRRRMRSRSEADRLM